MTCTIWVSLCNCKEWLKLQIVSCMSLSGPPPYNLPYYFSLSIQAEKRLSFCPKLPLIWGIRCYLMHGVNGQEQWEKSTFISETTRHIKPQSLYLAVQHSLHSPHAKLGSLQALCFFNTFSNKLQILSLCVLVMDKWSELSTFQIHKNTFLRAYSFVLHSFNEKVAWGTNNVNGMVQLSFLIG